MKVIPVLAALSLFAAGATASLAQQGSANQPGAKSQSSSGQTAASAMTQDKLIKSLQNAGFQNVRVVDAAYLVQATSSDGNSVMMLINPPAAATGAGSGVSGSSSGSGQDKSQSK